jgi:hypothetical protein
MFNLFGGAISWMRKRHSIVTLSTTEVEYMTHTHANRETTWLQRLCLGIGLVKNSTYHSKTKNIDVQYHFVRGMVEEKKVNC